MWASPRPLGADELLDLWDRGARLDPIRRALVLLEHACPGMSEDERADLPLGRRDALLAAMRVETLGARAEGRTSCPSCGVEVEIDVPLEDLVAAADAEAPSSVAVDLGSSSVVVRAVTTRDLEAASAGRTIDRARAILVDRCVLEGEPGERSPEAIERLAAAITAVDPLVDVTLDVACPSCSTTWQAPLDVAAFVWDEIVAAGRRLLREVHELAVRYGWAEADILSMSARRRRAYLALEEV